MKKHIAFLCPFLACVALEAAEAQIPNRLIDYPGFLKTAQDAQKPRESRRLTEAQFLAMAAEPGTIVLDARSESKFRLLHLKGAINLPFTEFTAATLAAAIPAKNTRVLIYCNNNFLGNATAFATKAAPTSLNISTYVALTSYGYNNLYELGPLIDVKNAKLRLEGEELSSKQPGIPAKRRQDSRKVND
jgi:rhodanese-related sulfurtransferase